jgi:hypothetical protein
MCGNQVCAVAGTIDGDFALGSTIDGADLFIFGGTIPFRTPLVADRTDFFVSHSFLSWRESAGRSSDFSILTNTNAPAKLPPFVK